MTPKNKLVNYNGIFLFAVHATTHFYFETVKTKKSRINDNNVVYILFIGYRTRSNHFIDKKVIKMCQQQILTTISFPVFLLT